jgi:hypothetical protein
MHITRNSVDTNAGPSEWFTGRVYDRPAAPSEIDELAAERETAIVLTCPWHARDEGLLALPVELVLPTHGAPTDRAALERALS